jgi:glycine/D-amino acid oxidase-like deaminating enzyme
LQASARQVILANGYERAPLFLPPAFTLLSTFGSSPDGLPAIGRAANMVKVWLSAGFGGNGIAFAALASEILSMALGGRADADSECFDPYRFGSGA